MTISFVLKLSINSSTGPPGPFLLHFPPMLTQAFASTVLVDLQGKHWQPSSFPTFIITACCPLSEPLDEAANLALHRSLQKRLQKLPGVSMEEIIGQSPDGSWKEPKPKNIIALTVRSRKCAVLKAGGIRIIICEDESGPSHRHKDPDRKHTV